MQHIRALFKQKPLTKKHAWPSEIIREAVRFVHEDANGDETPIDVQIASDLPVLLVEQIKIQEVLINLISNGIEAMESNARPAHLLIRVGLLNEGEVLIEVIDSGPGLKNTENIFDAFVTTKEKGMGIGSPFRDLLLKRTTGNYGLRTIQTMERSSALNFPSPVCGATSACPRELTSS